MEQLIRATPSQPSEVDELTALIKVGGFWRLTPEWVPRDGYADPHTVDLRRVETGLRRLLS